MKIDFDINKCNTNIMTRGLSFAEAIDFDWGNALYIEDIRYCYPEQRFIAMGYLKERLHVLCFTPITDGIRIISFRKANLREIKRYEKEIANR